MTMLSFIQIFGILIIIITVISFFVKLAKQPIIIGYVLAGLVFASAFSQDLQIYELVQIFSEIGITFLLFFMGLEFDLGSLKYLGKDMFIATIWQSIIFFVLAFFPAILFGFSPMESAYLAILFMFSSTLLVAKWIDDKKETKTLHGKITLAILIIQDVFAILILTIMGVLKESSFSKIALIPLEGLLLVIVAFVVARYLLNYPLKIASRYPELLFIISLSVCFFFVEIAPILGYSTTIGAFIGGIALANTAYKVDTLGRLKPLIIFFNMLFFVGLGFQMQLDLSLKLGLFISLILLMSIFIKPPVIYFTLRQRGYDFKSSFLSGIYLSQLSEFGIIIIAGGVLDGRISASLGAIAIITVLTTMVASSYLIKYDRKIFKFFEDKMIWLDKKFITKDHVTETVNVDCQVLFFGYPEFGKDLIQKFQQQGKKVVVVENDPQHIVILKKGNVKYIYNSINNPEFFEHINFGSVELAISSLRDLDENKLIIAEIKKTNPKAMAIVTAETLKHALDLYKHNADYVIYSAYLNKQRVSVILDEYTTDINKIIEKKIEEIAKLKEEDAQLDIPEDGFFDIEPFMKRAEKESKENAGKGSGEPIKTAPRQAKSIPEFLGLHDLFKRSTTKAVKEKESKAASSKKEEKEDSKKKEKEDAAAKKDKEEKGKTDKEEKK